MKHKKTHRILSMLLAVSLAFSMTSGFAFAADEGANGAGSAIGTSSVGGENVTDSGTPPAPPQVLISDIVALINDLRDLDLTNKDAVLEKQDSIQALKDAYAALSTADRVAFNEGAEKTRYDELIEALAGFLRENRPGLTSDDVGAMLDALAGVKLSDRVELLAAKDKLTAALKAYEKLAEGEKRLFTEAQAAFVQKLSDALKGYYEKPATSAEIAELISRLAAAADAGEAPDANAVKAARAAYDALTDEEKAAFDPDTLALLVMLEAALAAVPMAGEAITIEVNSGTDYWGKTEIVSGTNLANAVSKCTIVEINRIFNLKVQAGVVTDADWKALKETVPNLETFEILSDPAVTGVEDIPDASSSIFPNVNLNRVTIPQAIKVGSKSFANCAQLKTVNLSAATDIGAYAFYGCEALTSVSLPEATSIGNNAFYGCKVLASVSLPEATSIGNNAFYGCKALLSVSLPKATSIRDYAFDSCTALTSVSLPKVTAIGDNAFVSCTALTSVSLPVVQTIGKSAFSNCSNLATLTLGTNVPKVGQQVFSYCPQPRSLVIVDADGITPLTGDALATAIAAYDKAVSPDTGTDTDGKWYGCTLPAAPAAAKITVTVNGGAAVGGESLSDAVGKSGVAATAITALKITAGEVTAADWKALKTTLGGSNSTLQTFEVADDAAVTAVANIPNGDLDLQVLIFPTTITSVTIPQVIEVGDYAFYNRKALATVNLPEATTIGESAFAECALLTTVDLPKATTIGDAAFRFCSKLITMNLPKATAIGKRVFYNCSTLSELKLGITVPTVGYSAFDGCPSPRSVVFVDADSNPLTELTDPKLSVVAADYDKAIDFIEGSTATDGLWQGWKVREPVADPVASWAVTGGGTGQGTLPEALAAVKASGGTVTLLDNVDDRMNAIDVTISEFRQPVTLVLNGKTLHANVIFEKVTGLFTIDGTAEGSKIQGATGAAIYSDGRNFELKGGTYIGAFDESGDTSEEASAIAMEVPSPESEEVGRLYTLLAEGYTFANKTGFGIIPEGSNNGLAFTGNQVEVTVAREASWTSADGNTTATGTLKAALNLAKKSGGTVTLLTDAEVRDENTGYISTLMIDSAFEKAVTLVLNGHTLTGNIGIMGNTGLFTIDGSKNGSTVKSPYLYCITGFSGAPLKLKGGTYTCSKIESMEPYAIMLINATSVDALNDLLADGYMFESEEGFGVLAEDGDSAAITGQTVKVVPTESVAVTGVTLNKTTLSLEAGKNETLTATVAPENATNKAVIWTSSAPAVATVDENGKVTAVAVGSATITVTTTDGGKTATCAVTVTAVATKPAPGGKLEAPLTQDKVDGVFGEGNATLDNTATPPKITIDNSITPEKPIEIETDVTIDLGGNTITGKPGQPGLVVGDGDKVDITGGGTISGGDNPGGAGGNGITSGTGSDITIGGGVTVEGGDGGAGGDGINSGGNVSVDGSVSGGSSSSGNGGDGVDTSTGSGDITVGGDGTVSGGDSTGGNGNGGDGTSSGGNTIIGGDVTGGTGNGSGSGGNGATDTAGGSGNISVQPGGSAQGGNGGASGGAGGNGVENNGGGSTTVGGSTSGGNGGNSSSGTGGAGGNGSTSTGGGSIEVGGGSTGGNGGSGSTGGIGGNGTSTGGSTTVTGGGTATGGTGGSGSTSGGNGGNGASSGSTTVNGGAAGGSGGSGKPGSNGNGGNGGSGVSQGSGTVEGSGTATGGNGGSSAGTGSGGNGGAGVGGGAKPGDNLIVKNGISAKVEVVGDAKTEVKLPDPAKTVNAILTPEEKADPTITDVKVTLKVDDKTADKPIDANQAENAKPVNSVIGAFFDITLQKTITKNNVVGSPETVTNVPNGVVTITIEIPTGMRDGVEGSYVVIRVHNGTGEALTTTQSGNELTFDTDKFSTYAIAYTKNVTPPTPPTDNTGGGGGSSSDDGYDFWMSVKEKIQNADSGDVIKVNAKGYDKMPSSVMGALRKNSGVSLVITWSGKTITIPAGKAQKNESGRIYWPLSKLVELYSDIAEDAVLKPAEQTNPTTGGPGKYIPVTGGDLYEMTAPMAEQVTQPAAPDNAGATLPKTPTVITPPDAGFEPDAFANTPEAEAVKTNSPILWVVIAGMLTAAAVACGVWFWKRKEREQA